MAKTTVPFIFVHKTYRTRLHCIIILWALLYSEHENPVHTSLFLFAWLTSLMHTHAHIHTYFTGGSAWALQMRRIEKATFTAHWIRSRDVSASLCFIYYYYYYLLLHPRLRFHEGFFLATTAWTFPKAHIPLWIMWTQPVSFFVCLI